MLLFGIASVNLLWMRFAIRRQERAAAPEIADFRFLPELQSNSELGREQYYTDLRIFPDLSVLSIADHGSITGSPTGRAEPKPRRPRRASGPGRGCWRTGSRPSRRPP